ncbi:hypothetical protein BKD26_03540 [Streptomyces sp. CB03238]|nr:hypothetical protein BKD26_03540 [Streptomyces sp. CB03238]
MTTGWIRRSRGGCWLSGTRCRGTRWRRRWRVRCRRGGRSRLRALGWHPVEWSGWERIEAAEAELGRSLFRTTAKIPDWNGLLTARACR